MYTKENYEKLCNILLNAGEAMLVAGSDIARVEDTISHIGLAYNINKMDVFVITSSIVLTIHKDDYIVTQSRRINRKASNNFQIIEDINNLSRHTDNLSIEKLDQQINHIVNQKVDERKVLLGYILASLGFSYFYGTNIITAIFAGLFSIELYYSQKYLYKYCSNHIFYIFLMAFLNGFLIMFFCNLINYVDINNIIIGDIMLLIPGIAITVAFQNMLIGDTTSGIIQFIESLLWSLAIAAGYGFAMLLMRLF